MSNDHLRGVNPCRRRCMEWRIDVGQERCPLWYRRKRINANARQRPTPTATGVKIWVVVEGDAVMIHTTIRGQRFRQESGGKEAHNVGTMQDQCGQLNHEPPIWGCPRVSSLLESYGYFQGKMAYDWWPCMQELVRKLIDKLDRHLLS